VIRDSHGAQYGEKQYQGQGVKPPDLYLVQCCAVRYHGHQGTERIRTESSTYSRIFEPVTGFHIIENVPVPVLALVDITPETELAVKERSDPTV